MLALLLLMVLTLLITPPFEWTGRDRSPDSPRPTKRQIIVRHRLNIIARPLFLFIMLVALRPFSDAFLPWPDSFSPLAGDALLAAFWGLLGLPIERYFIAKRGLALRSLFQKIEADS
jgi:hypothetical protein